MKGRTQVKEEFISLETIEPRIVYVCQSESAFEQGMVVGARCTGLCQELQLCWVFHTQQFPVCIKNGPPPKGHPANFSTAGTIPVERFGHLVETMSGRN